MTTFEERKVFMLGSLKTYLDAEFEYDFKNIGEIVGTTLDYEVEEEDMIYDPISPYLDTCIRETLHECVAKYYLGRNWPTYGEKADFPKFTEDLLNAMRKKHEDF